MSELWRAILACLPTSSYREGPCLASLNKPEHAGEVKKPDALDPSGSMNGHGANKTLARPLVGLWA
jgi:hypothetical protein